jgi:hypothetical protein
MHEPDPARRMAILTHEVGHAIPSLLLGERRFAVVREPGGWRCASYLRDSATERDAFGVSFGGGLAELFHWQGRRQAPTMALVENLGVDAFRPPRCVFTADDLAHPIFSPAIVTEALAPTCRWLLPRIAAVLNATPPEEMERLAREVSLLRSGHAVLVDFDGRALSFAGIGSEIVRSMNPAA